ncbi:MAG TPA: chemotaxis response regulator protein-glutamate methylesterase [Clostridia bacterium]|jgi:two-component system chemotaxis response regulator CheB|nr:chemotaxis response regulator protein-glutamate methylesterase [Clostridia bacterium]
MVLSSAKVMVVDDSLLMRTIITDIINSDPALEVIDTAKNGKEALEKILKLKPDLVTLDIEMPGMDGLQLLELLMDKYPTKVIMLSSLTKFGAKATMKALELGAVDFVQKPSANNFLDLKKVGQELITKLKTAQHAKIPIKPIKQPTSLSADAYVSKIDKYTSKINQPSNLQWIVGIGTSTGGPRALSELIPKIPGSVPASFLVVQHMPPGFTKSLAERLNGLSKLNVKEAEDSEYLKPGTVYIAPGNFHLELKQDKHKSLPMISLSQREPVSGHRPSVDILFDSLAEISGFKLLAIILTGMGADGSKGMRKLKQKGAFSIAEAKESCVVFGMPKVVIEEGNADLVVPIDQMANVVTQKII